MMRRCMSQRPSWWCSGCTRTFIEYREYVTHDDRCVFRNLQRHNLRARRRKNDAKSTTHCRDTSGSTSRDCAVDVGATDADGVPILSSGTASRPNHGSQSDATSTTSSSGECVESKGEGYGTSGFTTSCANDVIPRAERDVEL